MSKLDERRKQYDIPRAPCLPHGKKVIVYRLPVVTHSPGGIEIPEDARDPANTGVLIAAGLKARDVMHDGLIEMGDIVWLPRFTTNSPQVSRESCGKGKHVEILNIEDLVGSVDAMDRLENECTIKFDEEIGEHSYDRAPDPEPPAVNGSGRKAKKDSERRTA